MTSNDLVEKLRRVATEWNRKTIDEAADEIERFTREINRARDILAGTDIGSLPTDHTLELTACARMNQLQKAEAALREAGISFGSETRQ